MSFLYLSERNVSTAVQWIETVPQFSIMRSVLDFVRDWRPVCPKPSKICEYSKIMELLNGLRKQCYSFNFWVNGSSLSCIKGYYSWVISVCVLFDVSHASPLNSRCEGAWQARLAH